MFFLPDTDCQYNNVLTVLRQQDWQRRASVVSSNADLPMIKVTIPLSCPFSPPVPLEPDSLTHAYVQNPLCLVYLAISSDLIHSGAGSSSR